MPKMAAYISVAAVVARMTIAAAEDQEAVIGPTAGG
jgi:hypothetical protein